MRTFRYAFFTFVFARLLRIAQYEIERIEDKNYVLSIFSGLVSFIALIVAIIALNVYICYRKGITNHV